MNHQTIIVLDFGGQYNQLIARRVRECGVYCEVKPYTTPLADLLAMKPIGFIFTGGPNSVYLEDAPHVDPALFDAGVPVLGICYGCQLIAHHLGGKVVAANDATAREYGKTETFFDTSCKLFKGLPERRHLRRNTRVLRRAVPSRGQPHGVRHRDDPQLPLRGLRRDRRLDDGRL